MKRNVSMFIAIFILTAFCACVPAAQNAVPALSPAVTEQLARDDVPSNNEAEPVSSPAAADGIQTVSFEDARKIVRAETGAVHLFAANVGKGDAIVLKAGNWTGLIDTGKTWARGRIMTALGLMGAGPDGNRLDAVFLTHTDGDHAGGFSWMTDETIPFGIPVGTVCASAMYTGVKEGKHPALDAARVLTGADVLWLRRGDVVPMGSSGAVLRVLAPESLHEDKDDNNSLVMMLESPQGRILLTGDMEVVEEADLLEFGDDLRCSVLKVPNHGDDDTTSAAFADACAAQVAVVSTSGLEKPGTPDPGVVARLQAAGSSVVVTEDSGLGILVTLKDGTAEVRYVAFPAEPVTGLSISGIDAGDDRITLENTGSGAVDLSGMYLYSDRGNEMFVFPDGTRLEPGAFLTVGTNSSKGSYDLLWDDKKVIHQKKSDCIYLDDPYGRLLDQVETEPLDP